MRTGDFTSPHLHGAAVEDGQLKVRWDKDHESAYSLDFLRRYADPSGEILRASHFDDVIARKTWDVSSLPASRFISYESLKANPLPAFIQLLRYGILVVRGVPYESTQRGPEGPAGVSELVRIVGVERETFYGRYWDVISQRGSTNIAYTDLNLDLHMDLL